jgi:hypothetical protein
MIAEVVHPTRSSGNPARHTYHYIQEAHLMQPIPPSPKGDSPLGLF